MTTLIMVVLHLGAVAVLFVFGRSAFFLAIILWWVARSLDIGMACLPFRHQSSAQGPSFVTHTSRAFIQLDTRTVRIHLLS